MDGHNMAWKRSTRFRTGRRDQIENASAGASIIRAIERDEIMKLPERLPMKFNKMGLEGRVRCHRCGSIMAYEKYYSLEGEFWGLRCICCGDIIDQIILENRGSMAPEALRL
jgi:hypothetical protein